MKKLNLASSAIVIVSIVCMFACNKASNVSPISLTASTTQATVGQPVTVTLSSNANASQWTVSPSTVSKSSFITTSKVNSLTFQRSGAYTVSVSTKTLAYDATANQSLDSCWNHTARKGSCVKGTDSTSLVINVKG